MREQNIKHNILYAKWNKWHIYGIIISEDDIAF